MAFFAWGEIGQEIITVAGQTTGTRSLREKEHEGVEEVIDDEGVEGALEEVNNGEGAEVTVLILVILKFLLMAK